METLFKLLDKNVITTDEVKERLEELLDEIGMDDFRKWLNGTVEGGVCFNRELYNQKLEWDQYENVTYELDITEKQLGRLVASLEGNRNQFSVFKNSCATVLQRAWNAAVGTDPETGDPTAYYLDVKGEGINAFADTPKGARDAILARLKGAIINNSEGGDPSCGFEDETGWVYVTAPKNLNDEPAPAPEETVLRVSTKIPEEYKKQVAVEVYTKDGDGIIPLASRDVLPAGTTVYVKYNIESNPEPGKDPVSLKDITANGESIAASYDEEEGAFKTVVEEGQAKLKLRIEFEKYDLYLNEPVAEVAIGGVYAPESAVGGTIGGKKVDPKQLFCVIDKDALGSILEYADEAHRTVKGTSEGFGQILVGMHGVDKDYELGFVGVHVYDPETTVPVTYDYYDISVSTPDEYGEPEYVMSGCHVKKGSELSISVRENYEKKVLSKLTCNGEELKPGEVIEAEGDSMEIKAEFRTAEIVFTPKKIRLNEDVKTGKVKAELKYKGVLARYLKVFDDRVVWTSSNPELVKVDEDGTVTLVGEVPEGGAKVILTAKAVASGGTLEAKCEVEVGRYVGNEIVGKITISARPVVKKDLIPHGAVTFTPYKDMDLNVSYFTYYKPTEAYTALMNDYEDHPEKYTSDPAMYSEDLEIDDREIDDRESYFDVIDGAPGSEAQNISLKSGESISFSNYPFEEKIIKILYDTISESNFYNDNQDAQTVAKQLQKMLSDEEYDAPLLFDSLTALLRTSLIAPLIFGPKANPLNGSSRGGLTVNKEMYDQFIEEHSQLPNQYYEVDITADEFAQMQDYLANRENNYYALVTKNCAGGVVELWNTTLQDKPELQLSGSLTKLLVEPESLYLELVALGLKKGIEGTGGRNFVPKSQPSRHKIVITSEDNTLTAACRNTEREHYFGRCDKARPVKLILKAEGTAFEDLTLENLEAFNALTGLQVAANDSFVKFYLVEDGQLKVIPAGTEDEGDFYVELTVEGESAGVFLTRKDGVVTPSETGTSEEFALLARAKTQTALNKGCGISISNNGTLSVKWGRVSDADGYDVFVKKGSAIGIFKAKAINVKAGRKTALTLKKVAGKKINTKKKYSFAVKAYKLVNGKKEYLTTGKVYSANGPKNAKYTNVKKVTVKKTAISLKAGKTARIKAELIKKAERKKLDAAAKKIYYFSNNPSVAYVSGKGVVLGLQTGSCTVFAIAANGVKASVKVTVK